MLSKVRRGGRHGNGIPVMCTTGRTLGQDWNVLTLFYCEHAIA